MSALPISIGPLYGALYLSSVMSTAFYGVLCMQAFFYYMHYQDDPSRTKIFVATLWGLNTIHECLIISGTYKYIMAGLGSLATSAIAIPELIVQMLLTTLVAIPTQGYFVYRIYIFSNKSFVGPILWMPLALFQLVASIIYVAKALYTENGAVHVVSLDIIGNTFFTKLSVSYCSVAAGVDVLIAIFLTYLLICRRVSVSFKSTARILERLTVFAVNSGIWTAVFSLLSAILVYVLPSDLIYAVFFFPVCSIYGNTLLANLNVRIYIQNETMVKDVSMDMLTSASVTSGGFSRPGTNSKLISPTDPGVWKTTEVVSFLDRQPNELQKSVPAQTAEV